MGKIGKFVKEPWERKRYTIDYTDWLDDAELVQSINFSTDVVDDDPVQVDTWQILSSGLLVQIYVSGGVDGTNYNVDVRMQTNMGQRKEDTIQFNCIGPPP